MSKKRRISGILALLVVPLGGGLMTAGCAPANADETTPSKAPRVHTVQLETTTLSRQVTVAGSLLAWQRAGVRARVNGYVEKIEVDIGTVVKKGDVLAFVAVPELEAALSVAKARAHVEQAKAQGAQNMGRVSQKRFSRLNKLFKGDPDAVAADRVDAAETHAVKFKSARETAEAMQRARLAEQRGAELLRDYQTVRAPFDGIVTIRHVEVGNLVGPAEETPMFTVASQGKYRARFAVAEGDALRIKVGSTQCSISIPSQPSDPPRTITVTRSSSEVDVATRTVTFEADVDSGPASWLAGLFARVSVDVFRKENALTLPAKALVPGKGSSSVWTCNDGKAKKVPITVGIDDGAVVEVLSGVSADDAVVLGGKEALQDGGSCRTDAGPKGGKGK